MLKVDLKFSHYSPSLLLYVLETLLLFVFSFFLRSDAPDYKAQVLLFVQSDAL